MAETRDEMLDRGLAHHRAGRLADAEAVYRAMLAADARDADPLHLLGVVLDARGDHAGGARFIQAALAIRESPRFHSNLGMVLGRLQRHAEALAAYDRALLLRPDYPEALNNRATSLEALGRLEEAIETYRRAIAVRPDYAEAIGNLGNVLRMLGRHEEAEAAFRRAIELHPAHPGAQGQLALVLREMGRVGDAAAAYRADALLRPDDPDAQTNFAASAGDLALAEGTALVSDDPEKYAALAVPLQHLRRWEEAEAACRRALAIRPDHYEAMLNLGRALREQGKVAEAEAVLRRAIATRPAVTGAYVSLAVALHDTGRMLEALAVLDLALGLDADDAEVHHHRGLALLLLGRLREGWDEYEWRFRTRQGKADLRRLPQPLWDGAPLAGKTIFVHLEQGFGDALQFVRYVPLLAAAGARVVLESMPPLTKLLRSLAGVSVLAEQGAALPHFDLHAPLLSLPRLFGTTAETIPARVPYLAAPADAASRWRERLGSGAGLRVGIAWAGNPRHVNDRRRSIPFEALAPLWAVAGVRWFSLQVGPRAGELAGMAGVADLAPELTDFAETAAAMRALDLVIGADTAVVHLAGALGVPCWALLAAAPDWRWGLGVATTPWYPSMRLFRQDVATREWGEVIGAVAEGLAIYAAAAATPGDSIQ